MKTIENLYCAYAIDVLNCRWYTDDISIKELYSIESIPVISVDDISQTIEVAEYLYTNPYSSTNYVEYNKLDVPIKLRRGHVLYSKDLRTCKQFIKNCKNSNDEYIDRLKLLQHKIKEII